MINMEIKWESNSRVKSLAAEGKINQEDIIEKTQTHRFPTKSATVRMARVREKKPSVTIHIRGEGTTKTNNFNNYSYVYSNVLRVNFGDWLDVCSVSGDLDGEYDFSDVDKVVKKVADILKS